MNKLIRKWSVGIEGAIANLKGGFLADEDYAKLRQWGIIPTVDFVTTRYGRDEVEVGLIVRSKKGTLPGKRWIFGGKQKLGETQATALSRIARSEAGIDSFSVHLNLRPYVQEIFIPEGISFLTGNVLPASHMQMHVYQFPMAEKWLPRQEDSWSNFQWFTPAQLREMQKELLPDLKLMLVMMEIVPANTFTV